jgi:hypothetical protein
MASLPPEPAGLGGPSRAVSRIRQSQKNATRNRVIEAARGLFDTQG